MARQYLGDFDQSATVAMSFNTRDTANAPITLAGSPAVSVYKQGSTTEVVTGVLLTVDYDGRTGYHHCKVDMSSDLTFYSTGSDFRAVLTAGTVAGISVTGVEIGHWSIRNRSKADLIDAPNATALTAITNAVWSAASRTLTAFGFTVNTNANATETAIKAKTDNLPASPAATGDRMDLIDAPNATALTAIASAVWSATTRILTAFGFTVNTNANATESAIKAKTDNLPADPASETNATTNTASITSAIPSSAAIAAAVATELFVTPANKLDVNGDGSVNAGVSLSPSDISDIASGVATALDASGVNVNGFTVSGVSALQTALAGRRITVVDPLFIGSDGSILLKIVEGDSYYLADGRQLSLGGITGTFPDWTDATAVADFGFGTYPVTITTATGSTRSVYVELSTTDTEALFAQASADADYTLLFDLIVTLSNGHVTTPVYGAQLQILPRN